MPQLFSDKSERFILRAEITADRMKVFIDVEPLVAGDFSREELVGALEKRIRGVQFDLGVLDDIAKSLSQGRKVEHRRVLKGKEPVDGADGKLVLLVKKYTDRGEAAVDQRGFANYAELNLFENIKVGQIVARLYAPKPGTDGIDALGKPVRAKPGKPLKVPLDKSLQFQGAEGGYQKIVALKDGLLTEEGGRLCISDVLRIRGDLGYRTGNVNFIGTVRVQGDVLPGFILRAHKGVEILGSVYGATVICSQGRIDIKGFVYGKSGGKVDGAAGLTAAGLEQARVGAGGDIVLSKEARASLIMGQASLFLNEGSLVGGETRVVRGLQAKTIGSDVGVSTKIVLCSDVEAGPEYLALKSRIRSHAQARNMIRLHLGPLADERSHLRHLLPVHQEKMLKLIAKLEEIEKSQAALEEERRQLLEKAKLSASWQINFLSKLYQGVEIRFHDKIFVPETDLQGPGTIEFCGDVQEFRVSELKELPREADPSVKEIK